MKKQFRLPKDFKVKIQEEKILITITGRNPIWLIISILLMLIGISYAYFSYYLLSFTFFGILLFLNELTKQTKIKIDENGFVIDENGFVIDEKTFDFEQILTISVQSKRAEIGGRAARGTYEKTHILVIDKNQKETKLGKKLITNYQNDLVYILNQFRKNNSAFIIKHFK